MAAPAPATEDSAKERLARFMSQKPHLGIQLTPEWVQSYLALRGTRSRVSAADVAAYHASRRTDLSHEAGTERRLYGVPKANWPQGFPQHWAHHFADAAVVQAYEAKEQCRLDHENMFILDGSAVGIFGQLGRNVDTYVFLDRRKTSYQAPAASGQAVEDQPPIATAQGAPAATDPAAPAAADPASTAAAPDPASTAAAPDPPKRTLEKLYSNEAAPPMNEKQKRAKKQAETFTLLKRKIMEHAAAGNWADLRLLRGDSVAQEAVSAVTYVMETINAIAETAHQRVPAGGAAGEEARTLDNVLAGGQPPQRDFMAEKVTEWFVGFISESKAYPAVCAY